MSQLSDILNRVDITLGELSQPGQLSHFTRAVSYRVKFFNGGDGELECTVYVDAEWLTGLGHVPTDADMWGWVVRRYAMQPGQWYMLSDPMAQSGQLVWAQLGEPYKKRIVDIHERFRQRVLAFAGLDVIADSAAALLAEMDGKKHGSKS